MKIFNNLWGILKFCYIISLFVFILTNSFNPILKLISMTFNIKNIFYFPFFLLLIITNSGDLLTWLVDRSIKALQSRLKWKILCIFIDYDSYNLTKISLFSITSKRPNILWSSFFNNWSIVIFFLVNNQILSLTIYNIAVWYLLVYFDQLFCAATKVFHTNFEMVCIFPKIFKAFC